MKKEFPAPPEGMIGPRAVCLGKCLRSAFNEICTSHELFSGQHEVLFKLVENEGITIGELAKKLNVTTATASVSVKRMEKAGFITKMPDEADGRITRLYPTEKAKALPETIKEKMDSLETILSKDMTDEEVDQLCDLLEKAIYNLRNRGDINA